MWPTATSSSKAEVEIVGGAGVDAGADAANNVIRFLWTRVLGRNSSQRVARQNAADIDLVGGELA